jgi:PAS domain S-box-containing protein
MRRLFPHRQLDDKLRKSEARYRTVLDAAFDAIVTITPDGIVMWFNRGAERIFGHRAEVVIGQPVTLLMPERYRELCVTGLHSYLQTGEARVVGGTTELVGLRSEGSEFPIELSLDGTHQNGERLFTGIIRDIAERKRFEEALERLSRQHGMVLEAAGEGIFGLDESEIDPASLQLEITEGAMRSNGTYSADRTLRNLKRMGVQLAIDDFSLSYSSLSYLKRFPVDFLKIDRSFIAGLKREPNGVSKDKEIVKAMIELTHALGLKVIAEGVETSVQLAQLRDMKCDFAQGNYFSEPLPSEALAVILAEDLTEGWS